MSERNYVGKGKNIGKFGNIRIGVKPEQLQQFVNSAGYVNLIISEMREEDKYGNKFTVYVDDFIPRREGQQSQPVGSNTEDNSDLPF
jgi:hypothetical protein